MNSNTTAAIVLVALIALIAFASLLEYKENAARIAAGQCRVQIDGVWQWELCRSSGRK